MTNSVTRLEINYLDASAAVKLVLREVGSEHVKKYFDGHGGFHITSLCLAEALAVLKCKWQRKQISMKDYFDKCYDLLARVHGKPKSIQLDDIQLSDLNVFTETEQIAKSYNLDLSDALLLVTVKQRFGKLTGKSAPLLITADGALASAAAKERILVWNCLTQATPALPLS
jgi:predicted nucleic acid-binding protein